MLSRLKIHFSKMAYCAMDKPMKVKRVLRELSRHFVLLISILIHGLGLMQTDYIRGMLCLLPWYTVLNLSVA